MLRTEEILKLIVQYGIRKIFLIVPKLSRPQWCEPQTYKYLSRCRTSYSRCIISCSHR